MGLLSEKQMVMKQSRTFEGWERYPTNLSNYHKSAIDGEALDQQLSRFSERLFCGKGCRIGVDIFEFQDHEEMKFYQNKFSSEKDLSNHLLHSTAPDIRVISIAQANSLQPLNVTEEIMRKILTYHDVSPDLLINLFCCGNYPQASEAGSGYHCSNSSANGPSEMMYTFNETFIDAADAALTMDLNDNADYRLSFSTLQSLRNLEDKLFPVTAALHASRDDAIAIAVQARLTLALDRLRGNLTSAETLRHRIGGIMHLLGDALNHKGQTTAMAVNQHMLGLTRKQWMIVLRLLGVFILQKEKPKRVEDDARRATPKHGFVDGVKFGRRSSETTMEGSVKTYSTPACRGTVDGLRWKDLQRKIPRLRLRARAIDLL
ncbi:hypothetical protein G7Y79_00018g044130 [Physcia stellaris]|nr:hypothetical protein G7Y79_00018g044130 [Physcia stellaris]